MTTKAERAAAADKSERMVSLVAEAAARVPTFAHITYNVERNSPAGARKARGHKAGARKRKATDGDA